MKKAIVLGFLSCIMFVQIAHATAVAKITWCHTEPNGNQQTLELPQASLENAGHVDASGNILHAGDHPGECEEAIPTVVPTTEPSITVVPTNEVTPTVTPSATPDPSNEPKQENGYFDDHLGCGTHSCEGNVENRSGKPVRIEETGIK